MSEEKLVWDDNLKQWVQPKKANGVAGTDASVTPEQNDMASSSDPYLLDLNARANGTIEPNGQLGFDPYRDGKPNIDYDPQTGSTQVIGEKQFVSRFGATTVNVFGEASEEDMLAWKIHNQDEPEFELNTAGGKHIAPTLSDKKNVKYVKPGDEVPALDLAKSYETMNDLDIEYDNIFYNTDKDTSFVDKYYPGVGATDNFNVIDFQGYLTRTGFIKYFEEGMEEGKYDTKINVYSDIMEKAMAEEDLANALDEYQAYRTKRANDREMVAAVYKYPEVFKGARSIDDLTAVAFNYENPIADNYYNQLHDFEDYKTNVYEDLTVFKNEQLNELNDKYERLKNRNDVEDAVGVVTNPIIELPVGAFEAGRDLLLWVGGWMPDWSPVGGGDWVRSNTARLNMRQKYGNKSLDYFMAEGKRVNHDGIDYIISEDGSIYDETNNVNITGILNASNYTGPSAETLYSKLDPNSETVSDFSSRGGAKMFGNVTGNIIGQIYGTKGAGVARGALSLRALSAANKLGRFKSVAAYNKYKGAVASGTKKGRDIKNKYETFGLNLTTKQKGLVDATMFQSLYGAATGYKNTLQAAQRANLDVETAEKLANMGSFQMSLLYALTGPINPRISQVKFIDDFVAGKNNVYNRIVTAAKNNKANPYGAAKNEFTKSVRDYVNRKTGAAFLSEGTKEVIQENIQQFGESNIVNANLNEALGKDFVDQNYSMKDFIETSIMSFAAGGLLGGVSASGQNYTPSKVSDLYQLSQDKKGARSRFDYLVKNKALTQEQADNILKDIDAVGNAVNNKEVPMYLAELNPDTFVKIANNTQEINRLKEEKKKLAPGLEGNTQQEIDRLTKENIELQRGENLKLIKEEGKLIEKLGGKDNVIIFGTQQEAAEQGYTGKDLISNGFMDVDGKIVIIEDVAAANSALSVGSHELLHKILKAEFTVDGNPTALQKRLLNEFKNVLKQKGLYNQILGQLQKNYDNIDTVNLDEWFTAFSDIIGNSKKMGVDPVKQFGDKWWQQFGNWLSNLFKGRLGQDKALNFQSGKEVYDFIINYQKNLSEGKLSDLAKQKIKAGENLKVKKRSLSEKDLGKTKERLSKFTKEEAANNPAVDRELPDMVNAQVGNLAIKFDPELRMEFMQDVLLRTLTDIRNNPWDGRGTLYGYLNGRIRKRILDAFRDDRKRVDPLYVNKIDTDALTILEKQSDPDPTPKTSPEVKQYRKLKDSGVVIGEAINLIKGDLNTIARLLKTGIKEGVGKNKKVTPFMRELLKSVDQSNIPNRVDLGTGDALAKRLLKHKKAIIENSTRTFLMGQDRSGKVAGGIPAAIEKTIINEDGTRETVSYPNWAGKKIARETVGKDSAQRTAGHDLTFKKSADQVSDIDFLQSFFKTVTKNADATFTVKGLIPGRKPAIEKHISQMLAIELFVDGIKKGTQIADSFGMSQSMLDAQIEVADVLVQLEADAELGGTKRSIGAIELAFNNHLSFGSKDPMFKNAYANLTPAEQSVYDDKIMPLMESAYFKREVKNLVESGKFDNDINPIKLYINDFLNAKTSSKELKKQLEAFITDFIDILPSNVTKKFNKQMFGLDIGFLNPTTTAKYQDGFNAKARKLLAKKNLLNAADIRQNLFWLEGVEGMQAGSGTMQKVAKILAEDITKAEKQAKLQEEGLLDKLKTIKSSNTEAMIFLVQEGIKVVANDPTKLPGFMQWVASSSSLGKALRSMTGLSDIQILDGSQAPYSNASRTKFYLKKSDAKEEVFANRNHPYYNDVVELLKSKGKELTEDNIADGLKFKGEHSDPSSYISLQIVDAVMPLISLAAQHPTEINTILTQADNVLRPIVMGFDQQLNAKFISDIQDSTLGATSKAGELRLLSTPKYISSFVPTQAGMQTAAQRARQKLNELGIDIKNLVNVNISTQAGVQGNKRSVGKGISVYDFDDTLAFSQSQVIVTMPVDPEILDIAARRMFGNTVFKDVQNFQKTFNNLSEAQQQQVLANVPGTTRKITPAQFAVEGETLAQRGAKFDFSEFNKVVKGTAGPLIPRLKKAIGKFGNDNMYVLTARPQASAKSIYRFLKELGVEIPLRNIVGLADGAPSAKANWMVNKVAQGFNDFYFVDDAIKNVKAVQEVLDKFDVNSKVQQAKKRSEGDLSEQLNKMVERNKGVKAEAVFSKTVARRKGAQKGRFKFFIPHGAEDFRGLTSYTLAGKGKQGDADQQFFEDNLVTPYSQGVAAMEMARQALKNDYRNLLKQNKPIKRKLNKKVPGTEYTYDEAIRVYLYTKSGFEVPGISKRDLKALIKTIEGDSDLQLFANALQLISKKETWVEPSQHWDVGSILKDLNELSEKVNRKEYLAEFNENVDIIFSEQNLNKLEAIYGTRYVDALKNIIGRMKSGINRPAQPGRYEQQWLNWVNNSVGTIMFFNRRSALLQMISFTNFINWSDNNPMAAGLAFANQPLYWKTWVKIFNSDKLKQRRGGLKSDIQEQEIANAARNSKDKAGAVIAYLLKIGFTPTQLADSFAIATGGATFLINRTKTYKKQGMSKAEAEAKAFEDFAKVSDETQQSGDPMLISAQQSSHLGRLILAFQNTPMQYTRLMKKAGQDLINGRGDAKTNISKIMYYGFVQNLIFTTLQQALFALLPEFDPEDDEEKYEKLIQTKQERVINGMVDTILRGSGLTGAVVSTIKNALNQYYRQEKKGYMADHTYTILEVANISPPIGSKLRKIYGGIQTEKFDKDVIAERGFDVTIDGKFNLSPRYQVIGNIASAAFNIPLDRAIAETQGITEALDARNTIHQRIALALGWRTWDVNAKNEEHELIKTNAKATRKEAGKEKAKKTRKENADKLKALEKKIPNNKYAAYLNWKKGKTIKQKIEYIEQNY